MQGAIVGFGTIGMGHFAAYQQMQDMAVTAIVDIVPERRKQAKAKDSAIRTYDSIEALLDDQLPDFIDICSPPHTHLDYIRAGLSGNCHVLCEKPFLLSVRDYQGLLSLLNAANRVLYPCHNYKFAPILQLLKNSVQTDGFGELVSGHFRTLRCGHAVGVSEWYPHWRRDSSISGGGILRDHGTHSIYVASCIVDQQPTSVSCLAGNLRTDEYHDTEDTALMTLQFENKTCLVVDLSWAANFRSSYYAVFGTQGAIIAENDEFCHTSGDGHLTRQSLVSEFDDPSHRAWFMSMFQDFKDVVLNPSRQLPLLKEALMTSIVIERAYQSAKQGGVWVDVESPSEELL